jgi:hypothetical protein
MFQPKRVAQRVALWEKRVTEERTCEIFMRLQKKQMEVAREAEEAEQKQEQLWIEQGKGGGGGSQTETSSGGSFVLPVVNLSGLEPSTVEYARTNVINSRTSFVIASVRSSVHLYLCM